MVPVGRFILKTEVSHRQTQIFDKVAADVGLISQGMKQVDIFHLKSVLIRGFIFPFRITLFYSAGGGFAEDEVGFHPGFFGADGVVRIPDLLLEPVRGGGTEAVVSDIDDG